MSSSHSEGLLSERGDILAVKDLKVYFPVKKGVFGRTVNFIKAVDGVTFSVRRGEILGLVGESGSGKSTIVRTVLGIVKKTEGVISLNGRAAMVFQDPLGSLNPRKTVRATLEEVLYTHKKDNSQTASSLLKSVGLDDQVLDKYPHEFSGGQRQRICIARALASKPQLLICDEAVSALDLSIRAQILDLIIELGKKFGISILFISHDLGVVRHIASRVIVLKSGRIEEEGECAKVLSSPQKEYTRRLIESVCRLPSCER
jgi:peptide/nickel transport system ATP-binding protein/oligopeptide transport system ATP-binding protein